VVCACMCLDKNMPMHLHVHIRLYITTHKPLHTHTHTQVIVNFTPHLMPMSRGILTSMYVKLTPGTTVDDCRRILQDMYGQENFVYVMDQGVFPQTRHVRGSNMCYMNIVQDRVKGRAIVFSAIGKSVVWD
ncbi:hypothetical protein EON63_23185, partial [archaeon]